jgi:hypothetical protein
MKKLVGSIVTLGFLLCALAPSRSAQAQNAILGVIASLGSMSVDLQNAVLGELHGAGVYPRGHSVGREGY